MKILIIQQKMIGDVLISSILFEAIKQKYPNYTLHYLINSGTYPVVKNNAFIDDFKLVSPETKSNKIKFWNFLQQIKKEKYDLVIDVYSKLSSNLITLFSSARIRISYRKNYTSFIYSHTLKRLKFPENKASLAIENRLKLLEFLNISFTPISPKIYLTTNEINDAKDYLISSKINLNKPLIMISVLGSSDKKTYPKEYMSQVLDNIVEYQQNVQLIFNYIPKQKSDAMAIYNLCNENTKKQIGFNIFGNSLREFLAITKHCKALIGNEGGAVNMAKALNIPTFTIFNPALNKKNWFGESEIEKHVAIHLNDYVDFKVNDAKKNSQIIYKLFKPEYFKSQLNSFLKSVSK